MLLQVAQLHGTLALVHLLAHVFALLGKHVTQVGVFGLVLQFSKKRWVFFALLVEVLLDASQLLMHLGEVLDNLSHLVSLLGDALLQFVDFGTFLRHLRGAELATELDELGELALLL